jgi:SAM-dependent methyltransferase
VESVRGKSVLHVGCTDSPITEQKHKNGTLIHEAIVRSASDVWGIDLCKIGIDYMEKNGFSNIYLMDAENIKIERKFDIIVAGDVVEHLSNPGLFLQKIPNLLSTNGKLIISVPHAYCRAWAMSMWYQKHEIVHKDHCCYYSPKTLASLCARFDLLPVDVRYISTFDSLSFVTRSWKRKLIDKIPIMSKYVDSIRRYLYPPQMMHHFIMKFMLHSSVDFEEYYEI